MGPFSNFLAAVSFVSVILVRPYSGSGL